MKTNAPVTTLHRCKKYVRSFRNLRLWLSSALVLLAAQSAFAPYHAWDIGEIYSSADGTVQFVELRALGAGQQNFANAITILATNSLGTNSILLTTNLPSDSSGKTCIIGTSNLATIPGGVIPNYIVPPNFIRQAVGGGNATVVFSPSGFSRVTALYTNLPTDGDSALLKSGSSVFAVPTNSPKNFAGQSNTIVPVKFLAATGGDTNRTNIVVSFRTATGVNGSTGPNYALQANDTFGTANWNTISNVAGNGTTKTISISPTGSMRVFRLKSP